MREIIGKRRRGKQKAVQVLAFNFKYLYYYLTCVFSFPCSLLFMSHQQTMLRIITIYMMISLLSPFAHVLSLQQNSITTRRHVFATFTGATVTNFILLPTLPSNAADSASSSSSSSLQFYTSKSGLQWADAKIGSGQTFKQGSNASIDYALGTTGARYGSKIYSNTNSGAPYRWTIGDGKTIKGIEEAIVGNDDIPPMKSGGIRRLIIPSSLAYESLGKISEGCGITSGLGPIPPPNEAFEEFQRFKNIYCNPNRAYQPDVVMDIKLYGKRSAD